MPRRSKDVRAQDPILRERLVQTRIGQPTLSGRPTTSGRVVLRLDAAQPADHFFGAIQLRL